MEADSKDAPVSRLKETSDLLERIEDEHASIEGLFPWQLYENAHLVRGNKAKLRLFQAAITCQQQWTGNNDQKLFPEHVEKAKKMVSELTKLLGEAEHHHDVSVKS